MYGAMKHWWETKKTVQRKNWGHVESVQPSPEQNREAEQCSAGEQSQMGEAG